MRRGYRLSFWWCVYVVFFSFLPDTLDGLKKGREGKGRDTLDVTRGVA